MTREEQISFCKKCTLRHFDENLGIICSISMQKADFHSECPKFTIDLNYRESPINVEEGYFKDELKNKLIPDKFEKLIERQNLFLGIVLSSLTGLIGAILWGKITVLTNFQIGLMPAIIGAAVGLTMRYSGKGIEKKFGFWGAAISIISCLIGNFLSIIGFISIQEQLGFIYTLKNFNYSLYPSIFIQSFSMIDLLFYAIAFIEGFQFSLLYINNNKIKELNSKE